MSKKIDIGTFLIGMGIFAILYGIVYSAWLIPTFKLVDLATNVNINVSIALGFFTLGIACISIGLSMSSEKMMTKIANSLIDEKLAIMAAHLENIKNPLYHLL